MSVKLLGVLLSGFAMISSISGGLVAAHGRKRVHLLLGPGAGMLLGATFFDLLPESLAAAQSQRWPPRTMWLSLLPAFWVSTPWNAS